MDGEMGGWTDGLMGGGMDGRMDEWTDGWTMLRRSRRLGITESSDNSFNFFHLLPLIEGRLMDIILQRIPSLDPRGDRDDDDDNDDDDEFFGQTNIHKRFLFYIIDRHHHHHRRSRRRQHQ